MPDLETQLREHADRQLASVAPVTADEARARAAARSGRRRWTAALLLATAAAIAVAVISVALVVDGDDDADEVRTVGRDDDYPLTLEGHSDWMLAAINHRIDVRRDDVRQRFTPRFLREVPFSELRRVIGEAGEDRPWRVLREVERRDAETLAVQLVGDDGQQLRLALHRTTSGRVDFVTLRPAVDCGRLVLPGGIRLSSPLDDQISWLMSLLAAPSSDDELRQRLAPSFLDQVPLSAFRRSTEALRRLGPLSLRSFEGRPTAGRLTARVGLITGEEARLTLSVEAFPPHRITGAAVRIAPPCRIEVR